MRTMAEPARLTPHLLATAAILALGLAPTPPGLASSPVLRLRETLRCDEKNRADYERMERGYYEQLIDAGTRRLDAPSAAAGAGAAADRSGWLHLEAPPFEAGPLAIAVDDVREF